MFAVGIGYAFRERSFEVPLGPRPIVFFYSDATDGGNSRIRLLDVPVGLAGEVRLGNAFGWPYAGMGVELPRKQGESSFDASGYQELSMEIRARRMIRMHLLVATDDPAVTLAADPVSRLHLEGDVNVDAQWSRQVVRFSDLATPPWWFSRYHLPDRQRPMQLGRLWSIEFQAQKGFDTAVVDTMEVRSLRLVGRNWLPLQVGLALALLWGVGWTLVALRRQRPTVVGLRDASCQDSPAKPIPETSTREVEMVSRSSQEREILLRWIGENYFREDLTVESAGKGAGIHPRRIAVVLKESTGRTFPAEVNHHRIKESKRLLSSTDRQIGEIALAVGFSNINHFHRVFKSEVGLPPGEWREQAQGVSKQQASGAAESGADGL